MRVIVAGRQKGKTSTAVETVEFLGSRACLIVPDEQQAREIRRRSPSIAVLTTHDLLNRGLLHRDYDSVVIDNADQILQILCRHIRIELVTMTGDEEPSIW